MTLCDVCFNSNKSKQALLHISILGRLKKEHLLWIYFSSAPLWWGGARLHQTKTLGTMTSGIEDWKETVTFEHGEREKLEGAQMMPCNIDRGQHHDWVGRLEMGDAEPLYTVCRWTSPSLREESKEIVNAFFFLAMSLAAVQHTNLSLYTVPQKCQVTEKKNTSRNSSKWFMKFLDSIKPHLIRTWNI